MNETVVGPDRLDGEGWVYHPGLIARVVQQSFKAFRRGADEVDVVVAFLQSVLFQDRVDGVSVTRISAVEDNGLAFEVGERLDIFLDDNVVMGVVTAND